MALYRVVPWTLSVAPSKSSYTTEEDVYLNIRCTLERKDGLGSWFEWYSDYSLFDSNDKIVKQASMKHSIAPWTSPDTASDDFSWKIGKFPAGTFNGILVVSAHG